MNIIKGLGMTTWQSQANLGIKYKAKEMASLVAMDVPSHTIQLVVME